ncbi:MAG: hypothetical protein U1F43_27690 [Myxococcota bacterium]
MSTTTPDLEAPAGDDRDDDGALASSESGRPVRARPALWARVVAGLVSLIASLAMAEVVAGVIRHHAFPFLNLYMEDPVFGVRLEPDASTRLKSRSGHITDIRTNALGFRGADWTPAPDDLAPGRSVAGRVMLLGDSQVFGYGVEEDETFGARLAAMLGPGHEVLNAATPTWGPPEYVASLAELGPRFRPEFVIYVANVANDWSEVRVPNARRTTARDGWARTRVGEEEPPSDFPGRRFLLGRSHLVYALRALFHAADDGAPVLATSATRLVHDLPWLLQPDPPYRSRLTSSVLAAVDACKPIGCTVIVVGLPLDVQVHPAEWQKYDNEKPIDTGATYRLLGTLLADARAHGVATLDLLPVLRAVSPGAFQADDYHLSPRGHDAVARALAPLLAHASPSNEAHR